jgi:hypothetical protein
MASAWGRPRRGPVYTLIGYILVMELQVVFAAVPEYR